MQPITQIHQVKFIASLHIFLSFISLTVPNFVLSHLIQTIEGDKPVHVHRVSKTTQLMT